MIADVINDWIIEFLDDIEGSDGQTTSHTTPRHSSIAPRRISSAGSRAALHAFVLASVLARVANREPRRPGHLATC